MGFVPVSPVRADREAEPERIEALRVVVEDAQNEWFAKNLDVGYAQQPEDMARLSQAFKVLSAWLEALRATPEPERAE